MNENRIPLNVEKARRNRFRLTINDLIFDRNELSLQILSHLFALFVLSLAHTIAG